MACHGWVKPPLVSKNTLESLRMGIPIEITVKRNARGKSANTSSSAVPTWPKLFDIPYNRELHYRVVLNEIRGLLRKPRRLNVRKPRWARPWYEATLRDAPMLKGFFADEPRLRTRLLCWCEAVLDKSDS